MKFAGPALLLSLLVGGLVRVTPVTAAAEIITVPLVASDAATASSPAAEITAADPNASVAAALQIAERRDRDITETGGKQKDELTALLESTTLQPTSWYNVLQHAIRSAVAKGVPANTIVLVLLFPLITAIIAGSRHIIGLRGFGVYTPAVLSVAFVSTGIVSGVIFFVIVLLTTLFSKKLIQKLKLQYLPRTAMMMWGVSVAILIFFLLAGQLGLTALYSISIFSILIIMLLAENFMETQLASSQAEAIQLTFETLVLAIFCSIIIGSRWVQSLVILNPELTLITVAIANMIVGRYSGLRLLEYFRFRSLLEK